METAQALVRTADDNTGVVLRGEPMAFLVTGEDTKHTSMFDWTIPAGFATGQHRVLVYGIIGVLFLRGIMIAAGSAIVTEFSWVLYIFAAFLVATGIKMLFTADKKTDVSKSPAVQFMNRHLNMTKELHGARFFIRIPDTAGKVKLFVTPLFGALVLVELADLIFAVDSIPAIFAITTDPYIVLTSNVFAILGLRALYFALAAMVDRFVLLKYALATVLIFIGSKIFVADMLGLAKIPPMVSLSVTIGILAVGILGSLWKTRKTRGPASPNQMTTHRMEDLT